MVSGEYLHYGPFGRSSLLENDTKYLIGGLEERVEYKHEMFHGEYGSEE